MKHLSFKQKLIIIGVIPIMIIVALIGYFTFRYAEDIVTNAQKEVIADTVYRIDVNLNMKVRYIAESIRTVTENRMAVDLVESYNNGTENTQLTHELDNYFEGMTRAFDAISSISIITERHLLFYTGDEPILALNQDVVDGYYDNAEQIPQKVFWSDLGTSIFDYEADADGRVLAAYCSIRNGEGELIGLLVVELQPSSFTNLLLENQKILSYQYTYIVDREGQIICADRNGSPDCYDIVAKKFHEGTRRFVFDWNGAPYYACGQYNGLTGWRTFSIISVDNLFAESDTLRSFITWLIVGAMAFVLLAIILLYNSITRPLNDLSKAMKTVQDENFELKLDADRSDEIGELNESFNYMVDKINLLIREVYQEKLAQKSAEMEALQAQINPHFLYNALDSVNWMLIDRGEMDISEIIVSLGKLMQYCIDTENALVTLNQECEYIQDYLRVQKNRLETRLEYSIDIEHPLGGLLVPKLILQPLVENSIKHAIEPFEKPGHISIHAYMLEKNINIDVKDDGCGMTQEQLQNLKKSKRRGDRTGIGVMNVERRLKLFFGEESELIIESTAGEGTTMTIIIPVK